jgi:hypothetical protein
MVAAAKKQRWHRSMPGNPVCDTAKQQAAATASALRRHDDQIGVGGFVDDAFGGSSVSDPSLDRVLLWSEPLRNLLEIAGRRLSVRGLLVTDA